MEKTIYTVYQEAFAARMVALREAAGLTQRELAQRLRRPQSVVAAIELGQRRVDTLELFRICKACGASPSDVASSLMRAYERLEKAKKKPK